MKVERFLEQISGNRFLQNKVISQIPEVIFVPSATGTGGSGSDLFIVVTHAFTWRHEESQHKYSQESC
jgi:hypothetical protein